MKRGSLAQRVVRWQRSHGRQGLPWQGIRDPYRVWLSEVMLQQTQVATALPYFERFLQRFPTAADLAAAPLDDVLALWSGLGYYSRARNLHRCAQQVVGALGGDFPTDSVSLAALPGIGRSTAAAIAAFCFDERVAILDGNVKRVLARVLGFDGDLSKTAEVQRLWAHADDLLPQTDIATYTQGLMDLGATVCSVRNPACDRCPLADDCVARASGEPHHFPVKTRRTRRGQRENALLWVQCAGQMLLVQRPATGVWGGLWSLPEFASTADLRTLTESWQGQGEWLTPIHHALTHFDWQLHVLRWTLPREAPLPPDLQSMEASRWVEPELALKLGLPAPLRKLLLQGQQAALVEANSTTR